MIQIWSSQRRAVPSDGKDYTCCFIRENTLCKPVDKLELTGDCVRVMAVIS